MALQPDAALMVAITALQVAKDMVEIAEKATEAMGKAAVAAYNTAKLVVEALEEDIIELEKKKGKKMKICKKSCTFKIRAWTPKIWWKPGGCWKLIIKRIKVGRCTLKYQSPS